MVGLKSIWLLLSAFLLLAACVPKAKQTDCGSNEAFNASLRTCVPVVGGPNSFITITSYSPSYALSLYKNDNTTIPLGIFVSNPYNQSYTIQWERIYNGAPVFFAGNTSNTSFIPSSLSAQVGVHFITAKVIAGGVTVASHTFQVNISNLPKPVIATATVSPASYAVSLFATDAAQAFSFTVSNNNADSLSTYSVDWEVTKNNVGIPALTENDDFSNEGAVDTNTFYLGTAGFPTFDPTVYGIGNYIIRARVKNATENVAEQVWSVIVTHPDLPDITARNIYTGTAVPAYTTNVTAYNGVPYTSSIAYNFIPDGQAGQADFCVTIDDGDGTYAGDGQFVRVDYYLDNITLIYSGLTTAVASSEVCLTDGLAATLNTVLFNNTTTTTAQTHQLVARVIDVRTNTEYAQANMGASLGTYPVTWSLSVQPTNEVPTVTFTDDANLSAITCGAAAGNARTCAVDQDTPFVVGIDVLDEFYDTSSTTDAEQNKITYNMTLYRNGSAIDTCIKTAADVADTDVLGADFIGPEYLCEFTVDSYDADGSVNPALFAYSVSITASDTGSPILGSVPRTSAVFTYNLTVSEVSTAPVVDPQGATIADSYLASSSAPAVVVGNAASADFFTEGDTMNINVVVQDAERDDHQVNVYLCTDFNVACTTYSLIDSVDVEKEDNVLGTTTTVSYTLPEDLVPITTAIGANVDTFLRVEVSDVPDSLAIQTDVEIFSFNARNRNPAPQFGGVPSPALAASLTTMVGYPLTIHPGTVTDASVPATENTIQYQWYVDPDGGDNAYNTITGATSNILRWTPSAGIAAGTEVNIVLCVTDGTTVNPLPANAAAVAATGYNGANGANCLGPWDVTVVPNAVQLDGQGLAGDIDPDVAIWHDTTVANNIVYSAYSDDEYIYIEKTVIDTDGDIHNGGVSGYETVRFEALSGGADVEPGSIKDISLAGDDDYLYIAYQAADDDDPSSPKIKIRRIFKDTAHGTKTDSSYPSTAPFGYIYDQDLPVTSNDGDSDITVAAVAEGHAYTVTFAADIDDSDTVTINGIDFEALDANVGNDNLCSSALCSETDNAARLAALINSSNDRALQGLTATSAAGVTTIFGAVGGEHLDDNATIANYTVGKLGKIVISGASWYLPFVDLTTVSSLNRIRVMSASITDHTVPLNDYAALDIDVTPVYTAIGAVNYFTNSLNLAGEMVIGSISTSNIARIHTYSVGAVPALSASRTLFSGSPVESESLRVSPTDTGNANYFAAAKVLTTLPATYEWMIGRYDVSLNVSFQSTFDDASYNAATTVVIDPAAISDVALNTFEAGAANTEARLLIASNAGGGNVNLYSVRLRSDNELSCGVCTPLNYGTQELSATKKIATSAMELNLDIGTSGNTAGENTRDVLFAVYPVDSDGDLDHEAHMSIINMEVQGIQSTTTDTTGTIGHRPPFIGSN